MESENKSGITISIIVSLVSNYEITEGGFKVWGFEKVHG